MPQTKVSFGVLGPLLVTVDGQAVDIRSARCRVLLDALLCRPNSVVNADRLIDLVWDTEPPEGAATTLRSYVMRLRRALGAAGERIETAATGYRVRLDTSTELDWTLFMGRCQDARAAGLSAEWAQASQAAAEAVALWRGDPLPEVSSARIQWDERGQWAEAHIAVSELLARAELAQGRAEAAIPFLRGIVSQHPHRESAHELLISALAAAGRRVEALEVYQSLRTVLVEDLGIEPGAGLRALQQQILAAESAGGTEIRAGVPPHAPARPRPQTLPQDTGDFTGRTPAVDRVLQVLGGTPRPGASRLVVIDGMGGVGKSALAIHTAHRASGQFLDGQLYADLRGTSAEPARPGSVLSSFLYLLGVPAAEMPAADTDRAALYRSVLADRQVLIVLDDARDTAQLQPLVPASPGCAVLVTVRHRLLGLPGSERLTLEGLPRQESLALLERIVGPDRVRTDPGSTATVLTACADLPLAIRVAAGRLAARPQWRMADLAARFDPSRQRRLRELEFGQESVRASLDVGFSGLATAADGRLAGEARALCLLGLWRGADLGLEAAASLIGESAYQAEQYLESLVDLHMVRTPRPGRYALHDLVREFAAGHARHRIDATELRTAAERLTRWYTRSITAVDKVLRPATHYDHSDSGAGGLRVFEPENLTRAVEWAEAENTNLLQAVQLSSEHGLDDTTWRLAAMLWGYLNRQRHYQSWIAVNETALGAALRLGDERRAEAITRNNLATALCTVGRSEEALEHLLACVEIYEALGLPDKASSTLSNLGIASAQVGRTDEAVGHFRRSIEISPTDELRAYGHTNLGYLYQLLERHDESIAESEEAERIHRARPEAELDFAHVLENLAESHRRSGRLARALEYNREQIDLRRSLRDRDGLKTALRVHAEMLQESGDAESARAARAQAEAEAEAEEAATADEAEPGAGPAV